MSNTPAMPYNLESEQAVIGSCILSQDALVDATEILTPEDFYDINNRMAFKVLCDMFNNGTPVDFLTYSDELKRQNCFDRLGGQPFFAELLTNVTTTANIVYHANIVKDYATRRRLIMTSQKITSLAYKLDKDLPEVIDESQSALFASIDPKQVSKSVNMPGLMSDLWKQIKHCCESNEEINQGFSSGYSALDEIIGGFQPGSLNIIAARPSVGKTALAMNIAQIGGDITKPKPVLIFSLEMSAQELGYRMLASLSHVKLTKIKRGLLNTSDIAAVQMAVDVLKSEKIEICEKAQMRVSELRSECKRYKMLNPDLALIVIDYIQLLRADKDYGPARVYEVSEISRTLKSIAVELKVPIIALSQLSRETEKRVEKKPRLSDLRDSGSIEQDADTVMLLYREDYYEYERKDYDPSSIVEIMVAKNRNGAVGKCELVFKKDIMRFC